MNSWLHFIGAKYYSRASFATEAARSGITRRLSLATLRRMAFGDRVVCAMREGKTAVVFGTFTIHTLSGLSPEAREALAALYGERMYCTDPGGQTVTRGCGSYTTGPGWTIEGATLAEIVAALERCEQPGKLMIGGSAFEPVPPFRVKNLPHTLGFRLLDWEAMRADAREADHGTARLPVITGCYYADPTTEEAKAVAALLGEVRDYTKLEDQ